MPTAPGLPNGSGIVFRLGCTRPHPSIRFHQCLPRFGRESARSHTQSHTHARKTAWYIHTPLPPPLPACPPLTLPPTLLQPNRPGANATLACTTVGLKPILRLHTAPMPEAMSSSYALLEYARDMHRYTLELWLALSEKLDAAPPAAPPAVPSDRPRQQPEGDMRPDARPSDVDADSPQDE
ncbi:hypothetical protein BD413DRAFT_64401 [Trametes elegans]|nr:hypothetical protein BD413DRAFT_64401 [Trametes elegans]